MVSCIRGPHIVSRYRPGGQHLLNHPSNPKPVGCRNVVRGPCAFLQDDKLNSALRVNMDKTQAGMFGKAVAKIYPIKQINCIPWPLAEQSFRDVVPIFIKFIQEFVYFW